MYVFVVAYNRSIIPLLHSTPMLSIAFVPIVFIIFTVRSSVTRSFKPITIFPYTSSMFYNSAQEYILEGASLFYFYISKVKNIYFSRTTCHCYICVLIVTHIFLYNISLCLVILHVITIYTCSTG